MKIDVNSDMGEGFGNWSVTDDDALMEVVSSANIACGFHAGDPQIMTRMVRLAKQRGVGIGAHPGLSDLQGFGRRELPFSHDEIRQQMLYQIGALTAIARGEGTRVDHVSFHAAMGNIINRDGTLAALCVDAIKAVDPSLIVFSMPGMAVEVAAKAAGMKTLAIFLADRAYDDAGNLVPRGKPNSVIKDELSVRTRVRQFLMDGTVTTDNGRLFKVDARSILVHSDTPGSLELARVVRSEIEGAGRTVAPAREVVQ
jgi:UPF0271 protein